VGGMLLGGAIEGGIAGVNKVRKGSFNTYQTQVKDALLLSAFMAGPKLFTPDGMVDIGREALKENPDILKGMVENMKPMGEARVILPEGFDGSKLAKIYPDQVSSYWNPETKQSELLIIGKERAGIDAVKTETPVVEPDVVETKAPDAPVIPEVESTSVTPEQVDATTPVVEPVDAPNSLPSNLPKLHLTREQLTPEQIVDNQKIYTNLVDEIVKQVTDRTLSSKELRRVAQLLSEIEDSNLNLELIFDTKLQELANAKTDPYVVDTLNKMLERFNEAYERSLGVGFSKLSASYSTLNDLIGAKSGLGSEAGNVSTPEIAPIPPEAPVPSRQNVLTKDALKQHSINGFYKGQEVLVDGKSMLFSNVTKGNKIRVIDTTTGKTILVNRNKVTKVDGPGKVFEVGNRMSDVGKKELTLNDITSRLQQEYATNWQEFKDLLGPEELVKLELAEAYHTSKYAEAVENNLYALNESGYYVDVGPDGKPVIRSYQDAGFRKTIEGGVKGLQQAILETTGPLVQTDLVDGIQSKLGINIPLAQVNNPRVYSATGIKRGFGDKVYNKLFGNAIAQWLTPLHTRMAEFDVRQKSDLAKYIYKLREAQLRERAQAEPHRIRISGIMDELKKLPAEERAFFSKYLEATSLKDWNERGIFGIRPRSVEVNVANKLASIAESPDQLIVANKIATRMRQIEKNKKLEGEAEIKAIKDVYDKYQVEPGSPVDLLVKALREVYAEPTAKINAYTVLKGAELIMTPDSPNKADFAAQNGLSKEFISLASRYENSMQLLARDVGIPDARMITNYFPHYARFNDLSISENAVSGDRHIPREVKKFASTLTRTGYFADGEIFRDPGDVAGRYINSAFKVMHTGPVLAELRDAMNAFGKTRPDLTRGLSRLYSDIESATTSSLNPVDELAVKTADTFNANQLGSKTLSRDYSRAFMKYMEFKAQGFKPIAGIRDATTFLMFYGLTFGRKRMVNMASVLRDAINSKGDLTRGGIIASLDPTQINDMITAIPSSDKGFRNAYEKVADKAGDALDVVSEQGFKYSLQPQVYQLAHAISYLETTKWVGQAVSEFASGKIDEVKLKERISLEMYDPPVIAEFESRIKSGDYKGAIDHLARRTGGMTVGEYSRLTSSLFFGSKMGRVMGQFSQWPIWAISQSGKLLTRGSRKQIAARAAFMAGTTFGAAKVSEEYGLDFMNWIFNPALWVPQGSPFIQAITSAGELASSLGREDMLGATLSQAKSNINFIANPLPIQATAAMEAALRYERGDPIEVVLFRLFAGRINNRLFSKPSLWDD